MALRRRERPRPQRFQAEGPTMSPEPQLQHGSYLRTPTGEPAYPPISRSVAVRLFLFHKGPVTTSLIGFIKDLFIDRIRRAMVPRVVVFVVVEADSNNDPRADIRTSPSCGATDKFDTDFKVSVLHVVLNIRKQQSSRQPAHVGGSRRRSVCRQLKWLSFINFLYDRPSRSRCKFCLHCRQNPGVLVQARRFLVRTHSTLGSKLSAEQDLRCFLDRLCRHCLQNRVIRSNVRGISLRTCEVLQHCPDSVWTIHREF